MHVATDGQTTFSKEIIYFYCLAWRWLCTDICLMRTRSSGHHPLQPHMRPACTARSGACTAHALRTARSACTAPAPLHAVRELHLHHCTHYAFHSAARQRATQLKHPLTAQHPELSGAMHTQRAKQPLLTLASYLSSSRRRGANLVSERATRQQNKPWCANERGRHSIVRARAHMCVCLGVSGKVLLLKAGMSALQEAQMHRHC